MSPTPPTPTPTNSSTQPLPTFSQRAPTPQSSAKKVALFSILGLLIGAGAVTPFAISYRNAMEQAQRETRETAVLAEQSKQEAIALEKQKGELRDNLGQAEKTITSLKDDLTARSTALDTLKQTSDNQSKQVDSLRADLEKKSAAMADLDERLKGARTEVETATKQNDELVTKVNGLRGEVSRMTETIQTQGVQIAKLVEQVKTEQQAKMVAQKDAAEAHQLADASAAQVVETRAELMTLAPIRIEERHATKKGRKVGEKSGVPFAAALDPIGDVFQGIGEGLFGKSGPVILVAVYKDGHEETLSTTDADKWVARGIPIQRLTETRRS